MKINLPIFPLRQVVMLPGSAMSVSVGGPAWAALVEQIEKERLTRLAVWTQLDGLDAPASGTVAVEIEVMAVRRAKGKDEFELLAHGVGRRRVVAILQADPYLMAEVESFDDDQGDAAEVEGLVGEVELELELAEVEVVRRVDAGAYADRAAEALELPLDDRLAVLRESSVPARLRLVLEGARRARTLHEDVLRARKKEIETELGEAGDDLDAELAAKIKAANLPREVEVVARKEARRAGREGSPDAQVARTYLEWLLELPWTKRTADKTDLAAARTILDEDHAGLDKVKRRLVEYLAVRKLRPNKKGPILLFYGPPGVGKTSLAKSIARALGREVVRASLGGVRDEAEIRGHRRTYIGALPGRIIQGLRRAGTRNPVFVLDEIDKLSLGMQGDPAAALLEVLDPEQNGTFSDHYVELPFDLSEVIFIATANDLGPIAAPLRDRMEIIELPGYSPMEKRRIATGHLLPKQLAEHGLTKEHLELTPAAIDVITEGYTREAGVRNLERELATIVRGVAVKVAAKETYDTVIDAPAVPGFLGPQRFESDTLSDRTEQPGVATGLAWTPAGGEILFIEAGLMPGKGSLLVTGQLGDVMKESAQAAHSWVRSRAGELGIAPSLFEKDDVHLHFPAGGVPKDGPSAGTAIATALVSAFSGRRVRSDVAMTGEITLRGHVLPVGGVPAKLMAAHRAGIRKVLVPARNAKDLGELPAEVRDALEVVFVERLSEVMSNALEPAANERPAAAPAAPVSPVPPVLPANDTHAHLAA